MDSRPTGSGFANGTSQAQSDDPVSIESWDDPLPFPSDPNAVQPGVENTAQTVSPETPYSDMPASATILFTDLLRTMASLSSPIWNDGVDNGIPVNVQGSIQNWLFDHWYLLNGQGLNFLLFGGMFNPNILSQLYTAAAAAFSSVNIRNPQTAPTMSASNANTHLPAMPNAAPFSPAQGPAAPWTATPSMQPTVPAAPRPSHQPQNSQDVVPDADFGHIDLSQQAPLQWYTPTTSATAFSGNSTASGASGTLSTPITPATPITPPVAVPQSAAAPFERSPSPDVFTMFTHEGEDDYMNSGGSTMGYMENPDQNMPSPSVSLGSAQQSLQSLQSTGQHGFQEQQWVGNHHVEEYQPMQQHGLQNEQSMGQYGVQAHNGFQNQHFMGQQAQLFTPDVQAMAAPAAPSQQFGSVPYTGWSQQPSEMAQPAAVPFYAPASQPESGPSTALPTTPAIAANTGFMNGQHAGATGNMRHEGSESLNKLLLPGAFEKTKRAPTKKRAGAATPAISKKQKFSPYSEQPDSPQEESSAMGEARARTQTDIQPQSAAMDEINVQGQAAAANAADQEQQRRFFLARQMHFHNAYASAAAIVAAGEASATATTTAAAGVPASAPTAVAAVHQGLQTAVGSQDSAGEEQPH